MSADNDKNKRWAEETGEEPGSQTQAWFGGAASNTEERPAPDEVSPTPEAPAQQIPLDEQGGPPQLTTGQRLLVISCGVLGLLGAVLPLMLASWAAVAVVLLVGLKGMDPVALASFSHFFNGSAKLLKSTILVVLMTTPAAILKPLNERFSSRAALVSIAYLIMMKLFYAAGGALPPSLFHALALVCGFGLLLALPWAIMAWLIGFCRDAWRWLDRHAFWAGAATACAAAAVGAVLVGWLSFGAELTDTLDAQATTAAAMQSSPDDGGVMSAFAIPALDIDTSPLFHACVDELHAPRPYEGSWRDQALRILQRRAPGVEEDLAQTALIKVCLKHEESQIDELGPYYIRSIHNLATKTWRKNQHLTSCPSFESIDYSYEPDHTSFIHASRILCRLDEEDRQILVLRAQGSTYVDIATQLGITHAAARQRGHRALQRAQELMTD